MVRWCGVEDHVVTCNGGVTTLFCAGCAVLVCFLSEQITEEVQFNLVVRVFICAYLLV